MLKINNPSLKASASAECSYLNALTLKNERKNVQNVKDENFCMRNWLLHSKAVQYELSKKTPKQLKSFIVRTWMP